jgi:phenylalanine-4-hydroxylase
MTDSTRFQVQLGDDHPGVSDPAYRARRDEISAISASYCEGGPIPHVEYTDVEDGAWRAVREALGPLHEEYAASEYLIAARMLQLPDDHVPQLDDVSSRLQSLSGFRYVPVPGLVETRRFYEGLGDGVFHSTQYVRHHSVPLYTPEPDVIHEVIGHGTMLASPILSRLHREAGRAARRCGDAALAFLSNVFWFSVEFGVVREGGQWKAYGAGLLSSFGEIQAFRDAEIRPLDISAMGTTEYDITQYQPVLFGGRSLQDVLDVVGGFFATFDDAAHARIVGERHIT